MDYRKLLPALVAALVVVAGVAGASVSMLQTIGASSSQPQAAQVQAAAVTEIAVNPSTTTVNIGENFTVTVEVRGNGNAYNAVEACLDWDPAYLSVVTTANGGQFPIAAISNPEPVGTDKLRFIGTRATSFTDTRTVFTVTFNALAATSSTPLDIINITSPLCRSRTSNVGVIDNSVALVDGTVTIVDPSTPTPTNTPVPATETPTNTPTNTPVPPTVTPTNTPTNTPVPPTLTPTNTPTNTPVPPTLTPTSTPIPPTNTPVPPSNAKIAVAQPSTTVTVGQQFTITVEVRADGTALNAVDACLRYNSSLLSVVSATASGEFPISSLTPTNPLLTAGQIRYSATRTTSVTDTRLLFTVVFQALATTSGTPLDIVDDSVAPCRSRTANVGVSLATTLIDGTVIINAAPTVTPTNTPVPPTVTPTNTPTNTPVPPTATPTETPTNTPVPPTATPTETPTNTPVPPTVTPTNTPTNTPVPPTTTPTNTPVPPSNAKIAVAQPSTTVTVGQQFTITVEVRADGTALNAVDACLRYDSALLSVVSATASGEFPISSLTPTNPQVTAGQIRYSATRTTSVTDTRLLFTVVFQALATTSGTPLDIVDDPTAPCRSRTANVGVSLATTLIDGTVIINAAPTETPTNTPVPPTLTPTTTPTNTPVPPTSTPTTTPTNTPVPPTLTPTTTPTNTPVPPTPTPTTTPTNTPVPETATPTTTPTNTPVPPTSTPTTTPTNTPVPETATPTTTPTNTPVPPTLTPTTTPTNTPVPPTLTPTTTPTNTPVPPTATPTTTPTNTPVPPTLTPTTTPTNTPVPETATPTTTPTNTPVPPTATPTTTPTNTPVPETATPTTTPTNTPVPPTLTPTTTPTNTPVPPSTGTLVVSKVVNWNGVVPNPGRIFEICIAGPSYPTPNCQYVGGLGGLLTWQNLVAGNYTLFETNPGAAWTVTGSNVMVAVVGGQSTSATITNTITTPYIEPSVFCPPGTTQVGGVYQGEIWINGIESVNGTFSLAGYSNVTVVGASQVGHPEDGCPAVEAWYCRQGQDNEEFNIFIDGSYVAFVPDHGDDQWQPFSYSVGSYAPGSHNISFAHTERMGNSVGSVDLKAVVCAAPAAAPITNVQQSQQSQSAGAAPLPTPTPVNTTPDAVDDSYSTNAEVSVGFNPRDNDLDADGDALTITSVTQPSSGLAVLLPEGNIAYVPALGFSGVVTFTYTVSDGRGGVDVATITVTVVAVLPPTNTPLPPTNTPEPPAPPPPPPPSGGAGAGGGSD